MCREWYLHGPGWGGADEGRGAHGGGGGQAPLALVLVDAIPLDLRQLQEVLHGSQVHQQRLRGRLRVLFFAQDLREKALWERERGRERERERRRRRVSESEGCCLRSSFSKYTMFNPEPSLYSFQ